MDLYRESFTCLSRPRLDGRDEYDLYQLFIPPIPAFFKVISALMTFRVIMANSETIKDIGKGKIRVKITTDAKVTNNHARPLFETSLSLPLGLLILCYRHHDI